ncbi:hypothetical protein [Novosphingobium sp.]|uniref:hypothetical protein n=1 Tax=Novosphingobium sp. TaxID=1874826 RepID=UPI0031DE0180
MSDSITLGGEHVCSVAFDDQNASSTRFWLAGFWSALPSSGVQTRTTIRSTVDLFQNIKGECTANPARSIQATTLDFYRRNSDS